MKWYDFYIRSTITKIESWCRRVWGKPYVMSILKSSLFHVCLPISYDKPPKFWWSDFTYWQLEYSPEISQFHVSSHSTNKSPTSHDIFLSLPSESNTKNNLLLINLSSSNHQHFDHINDLDTEENHPPMEKVSMEFLCTATSN